MTVPTEAEFASLLSDLDREAFARFLAALWTARGRSATVEDGTVVVAGGPTLAPHVSRRGLPARLSARRVDPDAADFVVTTDPDVATLLRARGVSVVDPAALHRALLYDLDRATADRLAREHLDRPFDAEPTPRPAERLRAVTHRVVPVVFVIAVVAVIAGGAMLLAVGSASNPTGRATSTFAPWTVEDTEASAEWREDEVSGVGAFEVAPGVTTEGITNVTALSEAHAAAVRNQSYEWVLVYRQGAGGTNPVIDGGPDLQARQVARVENGTESLIRVSGNSGSNQSISLGADRDVYTDGTARYVRWHYTNGTTPVRRTSITPSDGPPGLAKQAGAFVGWILDASETDVVDAERRGTVTYYRIVGRGTGKFTLDEYRVEAWVSEAGFVSDMEVAYTSYGESGVTYVEFRYRRVGTTTVERPAWVPDDSEGGTSGTATGTNGTATGTSGTATETNGTNGTATETNGTATGTNETGG